MAAGIIKFDRTSDAMRPAVRALQMIREGLDTLRAQRAVMIQFCDGSTSQAANWDQLAAAGGFVAGDYADANAAAQASFAELDSLFAKLSTDGSVSAVNAAILQACAKHGV
jgi:phosphoribosylformylglycinamidine (FGAM) synthase-like amidotransferase family enzyme